MKSSWLNKKLTFLVIQDANRSVIQFKLFKPIVIIVPLLAIAISTALILLYLFHTDSVERHNILVSQLSEQLTKNEIEYEQTIASRNSTIDALQTDIISLSNQADAIKSKVEELKILENEIKNVTQPIANADRLSGKVSISSFSEETLNSIDLNSHIDVGGAHIPVRDEDIAELAVSAESDFYYLDSEMDLLLDSLALAKEQIVEYQEHLRVTPSIWPTVSRRVTSNFGYRTDPFTKKPSFHSGIDIGGDRNDPVYATADGTVDSAGYDRSYGNYVIIKHENRIRTIYFHLQKGSVKSGQKVSKGEVIGTLGTSGRSTGPHLHYEVEKSGQKVDPKPYMQDTRKDEN